MSFIFSSPKPPPAPDYAGAAREQGAANVETARLEGRMNRPDVVSPYDITRVTDLPNDRFLQTYSLTPEYEAQRQKQVGFRGGEEKEYLENINDYTARVEGEFFNRAMARIQPQHQQEVIDLQTRLINAGITEGSVAYNNAMAELRMTHQDTLRDLAQQSIAEGQKLGDAQLARATDLRSFQTSDALSSVAERERIRDRQLSDYLLGRTQPLSEIATLAGGAPPPPAVATTGLDIPATSIAPPPIFAAASKAGDYGSNIYGSEMAGYGAKMAALGNIIGSG